MHIILRNVWYSVSAITYYNDRYILCCRYVYYTCKWCINETLINYLKIPLIKALGLGVSK